MFIADRRVGLTLLLLAASDAASLRFRGPSVHQRGLPDAFRGPRQTSAPLSARHDHRTVRGAARWRGLSEHLHGGPQQSLVRTARVQPGICKHIRFGGDTLRGIPRHTRA